MTIIKNKLTQMILVGLLFALILGVFSYSAKNFIITEKTNYERQVIIIDVHYDNKIHDYLNKLNEIGYLDRTLVLSQEFFKSFNYIKTRYKSDQKPNINCFDFSMNLIDSSIFIETSIYPVFDQKLMDECLQNLFDLTFIRLKEKLDIFNYNLISLTNTQLGQVLSDEVKLNEEKINTAQKGIFKITKKICDDLDNILKQFDFGLDGKIKLNDTSTDYEESFLSVFTMQQNLIAAKQYCLLNDDKVKGNSLPYKKKEFLLKLKEFNEQISDTEFEEIYKVEKKYSSINNKPNRYLSTKNIVLTFSIFGFIFGALLVYNFGSSKNKNE